MGRTYNQIDDRLAEWLTSQPVFFVSTAPLAGDGHINCSPKGNRGEFAVLGDNCVGYLDQTGSGAETIAHVKENGRIVLMFCAFEGPPRIVRLHGRARVILVDDPEFAARSAVFAGPQSVGVRALIVVDITRIADSCGYGVPLMGFSAHRSKMDEWADRKGPDGIRAYRADNNVESIDGLAAVPPPG